MTEGSKLTEFLLRLETVPSALARYKREPRKEMQRSGLSRTTINAILGGDIARTRRILAGVIVPQKEIPIILMVIVRRRRAKSK